MPDKCIVAMVKPDLTDKVVDAAKAVGATGATIIDAAGTGAREAKTFFGLSLDVRTEVVLLQIGRASCRERGEIPVGAASLKKKTISPALSRPLLRERDPRGGERLKRPSPRSAAAMHIPPSV